MIWALLLIPAICALLGYFAPVSWLRRALLVGGAGIHLVLTGVCWATKPFAAESAASGVDLGLDPLGLLFLGITSILFFLSAIYSTGYLALEPHVSEKDDPERGFFKRPPESMYVCCMLSFLTVATLVTLSRHFGLIWVAVEATTLVTVPLIIFHRNTRSLEAAWKYLILCSVGIALALLGTYCLAVAASGGGAVEDVSLTVDALRHAAARLNPLWLKTAFILFIVGYGAKMGLAPMHTWLPDAHSEAPSPVSMLLSGALLNCAMLAALRLFEVCLAAGLADFARQLLMVFGLFSVGVAAVFLLRQVEYKRMLAYSSVEHIGIIALGVGLGGVGPFGGLLHAINHSCAKGMLFLLSGNILAFCQSRAIGDVRGLSHRLPWTGMLWLAGFFAITGMPPFGLFLSEFIILRAALARGGLIAGLYLFFLALVFAGMAACALGMSQGREKQPALYESAFRESPVSILPPLALGCLVLMLGVYCPPGLLDVLRAAARILGGGESW